MQTSLQPHRQAAFTRMDIQNEFDLLARDFDLKKADFYFLDLIPLIAVIWADGHNQEAELGLLYKFTLEHIANLDHYLGESLISVDEANDFLDRFAHQKPSSTLLARLQDLTLIALAKQPSIKKQSIMHYCMDIAAACAIQYPFGLQERVCSSEKTLLMNIFSTMHQDDLI